MNWYTHELVYHLGNIYTSLLYVRLNYVPGVYVPIPGNNEYVIFTIDFAGVMKLQILRQDQLGLLWIK